MVGEGEDMVEGAMKHSDCCGASPKNFNNDCDSTDIGICPNCGEHCEFIDEQYEPREFNQAQLRIVEQLQQQEQEDPT